MSKEYMDVYDDNRIRTGRQVERPVKGLEQGENILVTHLCIFNAAGQMLVQQRNASHGAFSDRWDVTTGGGVRAGEDSLHAVLREAREELGLPISEESGLLFAKTFRIPNLFDDFYMWFQEIDEQDLKPDPEEVSRVSWKSLQQIETLLEEDRFVDYGVDLLREMFEIAGRAGAGRE